MNEEKIDVNGLDEDLVVLTTDDGVEHNFYHVERLTTKTSGTFSFSRRRKFPTSTKTRW